MQIVENLISLCYIYIVNNRSKELICLKKIKPFLIILLIIFPVAAIVLAYLKIGFQIAVILGFVCVPFLALVIGRLIKNKAEYGQFLFIKEKKKETEALNSGFECPFCGARFSFKRISCPDCGKSLNK